jgi:hypothetical protein
VTAATVQVGAPSERPLQVASWFLAIVRRYVPPDRHADAIADYAKAQELSRKPLTVRQREIYDFVCESIDQRGYAPSYNEIASRFDFGSLATVHEHLVNLTRKGWIRKGRPGEARAIGLIGAPA